MSLQRGYIFHKSRGLVSARAKRIEFFNLLIPHSLSGRYSAAVGCAGFLFEGFRVNYFAGVFVG